MSRTNPICSYGITKLAIEKYLIVYKFLYDLDYVIIRPSNPYLASDKIPNGIQGLIPVLLGKIKNGDLINLGRCRIMRDYIYIKDLVEGIYLASTIGTEFKNI